MREVQIRINMLMKECGLNKLSLHSHNQTGITCIN